MRQATTFDPSERLPWLSDPAPAIPRRRRSLVPPALFLAAMVAIGVSGWAILQPGDLAGPAPVVPTETVALPPPGATPSADAGPQAPSAAEREALRPVAAPEAEPVQAPRRTVPKRAKARKIVRSSKPASSAYDPRAWRSGIPGRIIQLGAFRTSAQAQGEWRRAYARYPLLRPLSPRVLKSRIRGRTYYRLQLGTFSQAHSELLCQRLRTLGEGCIVLGLPRRGRTR